MELNRAVHGAFLGPGLNYIMAGPPQSDRVRQGATALSHTLGDTTGNTRASEHFPQPAGLASRRSINMTFKALLLTSFSGRGRKWWRELTPLDQGRIRVGRVASRTISKLKGSNALFGCCCL